ncbi:hypothetical protein AUJ10_00750 [Candidatus Pacearchaeota archaeon CG1_02_31_27]|nr:MAG: hypothetical protein AUJ10_00750 [Candidatus Pacearchaeota archaeon CG1_02_31_27]PIN92343.1 MAG: hypothetical protein COU55_00860 [Candidatus Pacearchaeota archaeon CG10_big_fil_rev_8_21_14_0_10_31_59]PIZ80012.1 MAG: hypothetical protein COX99_03500 [Candidatus Pacearchaeota archaeon CG_4_10_14_0_2_um_filter_31_10]
MTIEKSAMYKMYTPEVFLAAKRDLLLTSSSLISLIKSVNEIKKLKEKERDMNRTITEGTEHVKIKVELLNSYLPHEEEKVEKKIPVRQTNRKFETSTKTRTSFDPLDKELEEIQARLNSLS